MKAFLEFLDTGTSMKKQIIVRWLGVYIDLSTPQIILYLVDPSHCISNLYRIMLHKEVFPHA
mgnify:CR=1 FL=1